MDADEPGLDNTFPDGGAADDAGQLDDLERRVGAGGSRGSDEGGAYENDAPFEEAGEAWDSLSKQDDSYSNVPTSAPPTARDDRNPQGMTMGSTNGEWSQSWPRRVGKPEHQSQWEANTTEHLNHAKMLIQKAQANAQDNDRIVSGNRRRQNKNATGAVFTMIKKKMSLTNDLIKALEDRHESVEDTIRQVGECLFQLQRAHRSKWAPLNVCERRLELRDTRPLQELVRDHTQEALEHERQTLIESRQELADQVASCKESLIALDELKVHVVGDLSQKRHGLRVDRQCLSPQKTSTQSTQQERVVLPQLGEVSNYNLPSSPKDSELGSTAGPPQEESRQDGRLDTKSLLHKAVRMEEDAMKLCNESDGVMLQTKRECQRATTQAQSSIARRADETDDLKRKLEAQMREIDDAVAQTEMSLARTKKKLESHEGPLKSLDKQFEMRGTQSARGGPRDIVQEEMEGHLETMKKAVKMLTAKFQGSKSLLENLKESRMQLTEDYRNKLLALKIEDACLKVTPRKAMELDRMDPRGGRCKVASVKRTVKKEGVYSLVSTMPLDATDESVNLSNTNF